MQHGFVVAVEGPKGFPYFAEAAVEQAALVAALHITREIAISSVEQQFSSNALHDLLTSRPGEIHDAAARCKRFGWRFQGPLTIFVARPDEPLPASRDAPNGEQEEAAAVSAVARWASAIKSYDRHAAAGGSGTEFVAVISTESPEPVARLAAAALKAATRRTHSLGISRTGQHVTDIPRLYQEARTALTTGRRINGPDSVAHFERLGVHRLLSNISRAELQSFVTEILAPVTELPEPVRMELLETLKALVSNQLNLAATARDLHYHYNTIRYRVEKLEALLGPFIERPDRSLQISVALQIIGMHEIALPDRLQGAGARFSAGGCSARYRVATRGSGTSFRTG